MLKLPQELKSVYHFANDFGHLSKIQDASYCKAAAEPSRDDGYGPITERDLLALRDWLNEHPSLLPRG